MTYNTDHTIENKIQMHRQGVVSSYGAPLNDESVVQKNSYTLDYADYATAAYVADTPNGSYGYQQPHAVRRITEYPSWVSNPQPDDPRIRYKQIEYDVNGNQTEIKEKVGGLEISLRKNLWDEENRLKGVDLNPDDEGDHPIAVYTYDAVGARTVRYNLDRIDVSSNADEVGQVKKDNVMIYPNGLLMGKATEFSTTENRLTYTKHYYIGSERISAKTGTVIDMGLFPGSLLSGQLPALDHDMVRLPSNQSVLDAEVAVKAVYAAFEQSEPQFSSLPEENKIRFDHTVSMLNYFYFHKDHLGSSSYITNKVGNVTQHMEYLPFGETLVDEHTNSFNSPFKYNGKELDEETGNYYYGARYYDPKFSIFISVDPLAEKYPEWSSYAYCLNNPVKLIDVDGKEPEDIIIRMWHQNFLRGGGEYKNALIIKSDRYHHTIDIPMLHPKSTDNSDNSIIVDQKIAGKFVIDILDELYNPDATTISLSGEAAFKVGLQGSFSVAIFNEGPDKGNVGYYMTINALAGIEGSITGDIGFINSNIPINQFNKETLAGYGEGIQGSIGGAATSYFQGCDINASLFNEKGEFSPNISKRTLYRGQSMGASFGIPELGGSGSGFIGWSNLLN